MIFFLLPLGLLISAANALDVLDVERSDQSRRELERRVRREGHGGGLHMHMHKKRERGDPGKTGKTPKKGTGSNSGLDDDDNSDEDGLEDYVRDAHDAYNVEMRVVFVIVVRMTTLISTLYASCASRT